MDFWTFAILIVIIIVAGDVVKKALHSSQGNASERITDKKIEKIQVQMDELDNYTKYRIEKRLQTIETIVVSNEYNLEMKFKRLVDD